MAQRLSNHRRRNATIRIVPIHGAHRPARYQQTVRIGGKPVAHRRSRRLTAPRNPAQFTRGGGVRGQICRNWKAICRVDGGQGNSTRRVRR